MATDNRTLGRFVLDGILPSPRGIPQIEVTFDIDANGILSVSARDKATGREQKITITASSGLNKDEVERMRKEAESHASDDAKRRDEADTRNSADTLVYTAEKTLRDYKDKIPAQLNQEIEGKIAAVKSALQGKDTNTIKQAAQELSASMQKVGSAVYQQPGGQQPGGQQPGGQQPGGEQPGEQQPPPEEKPKDDGTVEGEFREV
jgi:molecular chaperone DnaK